MRGSLKDQLVAAGHAAPSDEELNEEGHVLRKIVEVISKSPLFGGADFVELECGHRGYTLGTEQAGCSRCTSDLELG